MHSEDKDHATQAFKDYSQKNKKVKTRKGKWTFGHLVLELATWTAILFFSQVSGKQRICIKFAVKVHFFRFGARQSLRYSFLRIFSLRILEVNEFVGKNPVPCFLQHSALNSNPFLASPFWKLSLLSAKLGKKTGLKEVLLGSFEVCIKMMKLEYMKKKNAWISIVRYWWKINVDF